MSGKRWNLSGRAVKVLVGPLAGILFLFGALQGRAEWVVSSDQDLGTLSGGARVWERTLESGPSRVRVTGILFSSKHYSLMVADNPAEQATKLAAIAPSLGACAGSNASYFHADWRPIGLVVSGGEQLHGQERAQLLSGILAVRKGRLELVRSSAFAGTKGVSEAIQAGPWLLENGQTVAGLNAVKRARRSLVATDGRGRWALVALSPATLAEGADLLASGRAFPDWQPRDALNLDGGRSTALWADLSPVPLSIPEFGSVRNFLLLKQK